VEYPGHGASANPTLINDMEVLVKYLVDHLKLEQQEEPYALLGHSMGAIVAFEVARYMQKLKGKPQPTCVIPVAQMAAHLMYADWPLEISDYDFAQSLIQMGGVTEEVLAAPEVLASVIAVCRNDNEMEHAYAEKMKAGDQIEKLACPIFPIHFTEDAPQRDAAALDRWPALSHSDLGKTIHIKGDHFVHTTSQGHRDLKKSVITVIVAAQEQSMGLPLSCDAYKKLLERDPHQAPKTAEQLSEELWNRLTARREEHETRKAQQAEEPPHVVVTPPRASLPVVERVDALERSVFSDAVRVDAWIQLNTVLQRVEALEVELVGGVQPGALVERVAALETTLGV